MTLIVTTRYVVAAGEGADFARRARAALDVLRVQPGCRRGHLGRSMDDPVHWVLHTEWESVGSYRRALSSYDVKLGAVPLLGEAVPEPTAYEALVEADARGLRDAVSDLAPDAATAAPREPRAR